MIGDVIDAVAQDLAVRKELGLARYGKPLALGVADARRDPLAEAYAEALDLVVYLRWALSLRIPPPDAATPPASAGACTGGIDLDQQEGE